MIRSSIPRIRKPAPPIHCHIPNVWHCILNTIEYRFDITEGILDAKELEIKERAFIRMLDSHSMISPAERNIICDYITKCCERICKMYELVSYEDPHNEDIRQMIDAMVRRSER